MSSASRLPDHPTLADNKEGWARRRTLQNDHTGANATEWSLPAVFVFDPVFQAARVKASKITSKPISPESYGDLLRPISWNEYTNYLANKRKNTAPGKSGVRYAHVAYAPEYIQRGLLQLLNAALSNRIVFDSWRDELIYQ
jgi:hypothetical protein